MKTPSAALPKSAGLQDRRGGVARVARALLSRFQLLALPPAQRCAGELRRGGNPACLPRYHPWREVADTLGIVGAKLIMPGDLTRSMIRHRDNLLGTSQMPPLAKNVVDADYISVLSDWINSMPPSFTLPVTLGSKSEGTAVDTITDSSDSYINANRFAASSSGSLTEIDAKVGAIAGSYRCAVYSDASGSASTLLRASSTLTNVSAGCRRSHYRRHLHHGRSYYWLAIWSAPHEGRARPLLTTGGDLRSQSILWQLACERQPRRCQRLHLLHLCHRSRWWRAAVRHRHAASSAVCILGSRFPHWPGPEVQCHWPAQRAEDQSDHR